MDGKERHSDTSQDFFCVPRPASPPVRRLVIGTHHLEYGFPSTHSANSVGMAIFFYYLVEMARPYVLAVFSDDHPMFTYWFAETYLMEGLILLYAWTIVYGRLYSGMHSALGTFDDGVQLTSRLFRRLLHWCLCGALCDLDRPETRRLLAGPKLLRFVSILPDCPCSASGDLWCSMFVPRYSYSARGTMPML